MGTSNFSRLKNASKYYTIFMNVEEKYVECNECDGKFYEYEPEYETAESELYCGKCGSDAIEFKEEDRSLESWEINNWESYFRECLENIGGEYDESDRDRKYIGAFNFSKWYADVLVELRFRLYYDIGYYEGANLDYDILVYNGFEYSDELENSLECIFEDSDDLSVGMQKIQAKNAMKWIEKVKAEISEKIENLFSEVCDNRLELVGTFSNGESIYREVK